MREDEELKLYQALKQKYENKNGVDKRNNELKGEAVYTAENSDWNGYFQAEGCLYLDYNKASAGRFKRLQTKE